MHVKKYDLIRVIYLVIQLYIVARGMYKDDIVKSEKELKCENAKCFHVERAYNINGILESLNSLAFK